MTRVHKFLMNGTNQRLLCLCLVVPLVAAAFAPPEDRVAGLSVAARSCVLHPISRMIDRSDVWQVLARYEFPDSGDWALVACHREARGEGLVDPSGVIVFTQSAVTGAMITYTFDEDDKPGEPLPLWKVTDRTYLSTIRRSLQYQGRVMGCAEDPLAVQLASKTLAMQVRELDKPPVALTSTLD